jgi:hypothetical protein
MMERFRPLCERFCRRFRSICGRHAISHESHAADDVLKRCHYDLHLFLHVTTSESLAGNSQKQAIPIIMLAMSQAFFVTPLNVAWHEHVTLIFRLVWPRIRFTVDGCISRSARGTLRFQIAFVCGARPWTFMSSIGMMMILRNCIRIAND